MEMDTKPGCYGSALTYQEDSPVCRQCPYAQNCAPLSIASSERIRLKFGHAIKKPAAKKPKAAPVKVGLVPVLSAHVQNVLAFLEDSKVVVTEALRDGRNPIKEKPLFLRVACHMLLRTTNGLDRATLSQGLIQAMKCTPREAEAYAFNAFQVLIALGALQEVEGRYWIKKD